MTNLPQDREPGPGSVDWSELAIGRAASGEPVALPVVTVSGPSAGPTMLVIACLHGDEVLGSDIVRRLAAGMDPSSLRGRLIGVPMANVQAVATRTRRSMAEVYPGPLDMNRVFPGRANGSIVERIAARITSELIAHADAVVDLHSPALGACWVPYASAPAVDNGAELRRRTRTLAEVLGTALIVVAPPIEGSLVQAALGAGVPATYLEFGAAHVIGADDACFGVVAIRRAMGWLGMLDEDKVVGTANSEPVVVNQVIRLTANRGGYLTYRVPLGARVAEGDVIATVEDLTGTVLEEVTAPADGVCCRYSTMGLVSTGDPVVFLGRLESIQERVILRAILAVGSCIWFGCDG